MEHLQLGEVLRSLGYINDAQLEKALELQKTSHQRIGTVLVNEGMITLQQMAAALADQLGIEYVDLSRIAVPTELARVVPRSVASEYSLVPISADADTVVIAMADPTDFFAVEQVRAVSRRRVCVKSALPSEVENAVNLLYGSEEAAKAIEEMRSETGQSKRRRVAEEKKPADDSSSAPTVRLVNSIIERGVRENASDIHLEPRERDMDVRMRIDGILHRVMTVPGSFAGSVVARIKVMSDLDLTERRLPQDGRADINVGGIDIDLRISTLPTIWGEKVTIRILNKKARLMSAEALGLFGAELDKYNRLMKCSDGMVLIVGPTGSGKSSTMYTMINSLNTEEVNLVTLEDPVEYDIDGVNQVQINDKAGMTFSGGLRSVLRQDPDIIAVGEIRDGETARIALRAAITGHLVLSTVHTSSVASLLDRLTDIGCEPYMISAALRGVISQRLVRRICPECREEYVPDSSELRRLGISSDNVKLYRGTGCPSCHHTGYRGRIGVFEVLILSRTVKRMIAENRPRAQIEEQAASEGGFRTLADSARELVLRGITTLSEMAGILDSTD